MSNNNFFTKFMCSTNKGIFLKLILVWILKRYVAQYQADSASTEKELEK